MFQGDEGGVSWRCCKFDVDPDLNWRWTWPKGTLYALPLPDSAGSLQKIVWSNLETVFKVLVESLAIFGIVGLIMANFGLVALATLV